MGFAAALFLLPPNMKQLRPSSCSELITRGSLVLYVKRPKRNRSVFPVARLFGPATFESSKLKVLFVGIEEAARHPGKLARAYTLTHSDITSKLTLAISNTINGSQLQGWYNKLQRDEVVAEWRKVKGKMSLHVHVHISGGHFLLDLIAGLRHYIFTKELPVVLKAFVHGDGGLFSNYPELEEAMVWVYFHSNIPKFNRVECWGPLRDASDRRWVEAGVAAAADCEPPTVTPPDVSPERCQVDCECCFPPHSLIPWPQHLHGNRRQPAGQPQQ